MLAVNASVFQGVKIFIRCIFSRYEPKPNLIKCTRIRTKTTYLRSNHLFRVTWYL